MPGTYDPTDAGSAQARRVYVTAASTWPDSHVFTSAGANFLGAIGSSAKGVIFHGSGRFRYQTNNPIVTGEWTTEDAAAGVQFNASIAAIDGATLAAFTADSQGRLFTVIW